MNKTAFLNISRARQVEARTMVVLDVHLEVLAAERLLLRAWTIPLTLVPEKRPNHTIYVDSEESKTP